jgi:GH18 family chitinase
MMTYDYHGEFTEVQLVHLGKWDQVTGINSPLYRGHLEMESQEDWKNTVPTRMD